MPKNDLSTQISQAVGEWSDEKTREIEAVLDDIAKEAKEKLKQTSPRNASNRSKKYYRGWAVDKKISNGRAKIEIHNKTNPGLTHLLEKGHKKRNNRGFVTGQPHIAPVNDWAQKEAEKRIKEVLSE